jgi:dethiobiotin synthetase
LKGWFVTGTDTGVGKTYVAAALARRARHHGAKVFAFKPIETGCVGLGEDQRELCAAAGAWQAGDLAGLYRFSKPVAPRVAAAAEGTEIDIDRICQVAAEGSRLADLTIVEGAGGWRVPVTDRVDMASLAVQVGLPVVVAARAALGTINHSLLTVQAIEADGCTVSALVLSQLPSDSEELATSNCMEISRLWSGEIVLLRADPTVLDPLIRSTWNTGSLAPDGHERQP